MEPYLATLLAVAASMTAIWLVSLVLGDSSIVDPLWGMAFVVIAWTTFVVLGGPAEATARGLLLVALVTVWGVRLSAYLGWRNLGKGEDYRYQGFRRRWGAAYPLASLVVVFLLQAILAWIVSLPVQAGQQGGGPLGPLDAAGVALWAFGLAFESIGDWQLARFKAVPANRGRVLDTGLWRYTRHPNYFGDACVWWGLYLIAASAGAWWTIIGPIVMTVLLVRVSGVAMLERTIAERRPEYAAYVRRTSAFIPRPPRDP